MSLFLLNADTLSLLGQGCCNESTAARYPHPMPMLAFPTAICYKQPRYA